MHLEVLVHFFDLAKLPFSHEIASQVNNAFIRLSKNFC